MIRKWLLFLFSTRHGEGTITWLSLWHLFYMIVVFGAVILTAQFAKRHTDVAWRSIVSTTAKLIPIVYILDFFIMPFSLPQAGIQVIKLPFHICTLHAFFIPLVQFHPHFAKWREAVAALSITCSGLFLLYPGSALGSFYPLCYTVIQTFVYHGLMLCWGVVYFLRCENIVLFPTIKRVSLIVAAAIGWAMFGNAAYSHSTVQYDWFMLTGRSLPLSLNATQLAVLPYIMPFMVFGVTVAVSTVVLAVARRAKNRIGYALTPSR